MLFHLSPSIIGSADKFIPVFTSVCIFVFPLLVKNPTGKKTKEKTKLVNVSAMLHCACWRVSLYCPLFAWWFSSYFSPVQPPLMSSAGLTERADPSGQMNHHSVLVTGCVCRGGRGESNFMSWWDAPFILTIQQTSNWLIMIKPTLWSL